MLCTALVCVPLWLVAHDACLQLTCRFEYLRIICNYEHYVALNLPLTDKHVQESITQLSMTYKDRHYLAWLLLDALRSQLRSCTSIE